MIIETKSRLWLRWVGANALAELIGLGATFALDILILARVTAATSALASLAGIVLMAATGAIEGSVVGLLQWSCCAGLSRRLRVVLGWSPRL